MTQLKFARVLTLPATPAASTVYFVKDAINTGKMEIHVSDTTGSSTIHVPTTVEIAAMSISTARAFAMSMFFGN